MDKMRKAPRFKSFGSVRIAFKLDRIKKNDIWFNENFGSGSIYSSGEETIFLNEAHKKGLKIYEYPKIIAKVDFSASTWREGYNEKYFYDKGALLAAAYPKFKYIFLMYFLKKLSRYSTLDSKVIIKLLVAGIRNYSKKKSYTDYIKQIQS